MRDHFDGAIFEGVLFGGGTGRGSLFGTNYIPVYDPLNTANIMHLGQAAYENNEAEGAVNENKKCCGGTSPSCKGCDNCGPR